jgi:hypothetical protein
VRRDWENWIGTPQFWCTSDPLHIAIAPKYPEDTSTAGAFNPFAFSDAFFIGETAPSGRFKLVYWAIAPTLTSYLSLFLTASDVQNMFEFYATADLLESAEEFSKAQEYWEKYYNSLMEYSSRVKRYNKSDLLLRV